MIDHVSIPVKNLQESTDFYQQIFDPIGFKLMIEKQGTVGFGKKYPEFWLNERANLDSVNVSDGFHVCLRTASKESVQAFYDTALALGAAADGEPGYRDEYAPTYYAAFVKDRDGNRIEVVTFVEKID